MYSNAKFIKNFLTNKIESIQVDINGATSFVPLDPKNTDYRNIMELKEQNLLQIKAADEPSTMQK